MRAYLAALNAADVEAVLACVAEDFVNEHTAVDAVSRFGKAAYAAALPGFLQDFDGLRYRAESIISDGAQVAVPYRMSFRHRPSSGAPVSVRGAFVFVLTPEGLIGRRTDYWDSGEVGRQIAAFHP
ncbi:nuclear transport factor 2 family protein [Kineosporia sp. NBRC 101731]|uniref:nuclear transport factor 2 family protein n=1 Tax=Kineosporia sp. NBRC 101731 TaxID=3032199 RepID=UPI0024A2BD14|nr:nuclear transport factor 2 family protein [Kineosporia sp. NBRC 101731]GLY31632.1 hypothetical protein Kisp02_49970 [Kineosporia sp. NBRC 101731]